MTGFIEGVRWELVSDGIQILMCTLILVCLILNQLKRRRRLPEPEARTAAAAFSQEVLLQSIRQQAEQGLQAILDVVEAERAKLQPLLTGAAVPRIHPEPVESGLPPEPPPFRLGAGDPAVEAEASTRYARLKHLAGQGLSLRQIADQTRLPAGEVELAIKLKRASA